MSRYPLKILQLPPYFPESCPCQQTLLCFYSTTAAPHFQVMTRWFTFSASPPILTLDSWTVHTPGWRWNAKLNVAPDQKTQSSECAKPHVMPCERVLFVWGETSRLKTYQTHYNSRNSSIWLGCIRKMLADMLNDDHFSTLCLGYRGF